MQGYCWAHIANARWVGNDHSGADEAFARAWDLWRAGSAQSDPDLLAEWRLLDLEASLRRAERRFPESLERSIRLEQCLEETFRNGASLAEARARFRADGRDSECTVGLGGSGALWIFSAQGIAREALAALSLFCDAARREEATAELARRTIADIEQARRAAPLHSTPPPRIRTGHVTRPG